MSTATRFAIAALVLLVPNVADAIWFTEGSPAGTCSWASVVKIGYCSATLISPETILTAGHCSDPLWVKFGESNLDDGGEVESIDAEDCLAHYLWDNEEEQGVDLKVCRIDDLTPAPNVPTIPIMVPTGPARDWLRSQIYDHNGNLKFTTASTPEVIVVGAGLNEYDPNPQGTDHIYGNKRYGSAWLHYQDPYNDGSVTQLRSGKEAGQGTFVQFRVGDSGGALFLQFPDLSWMQIGVAHESGGGVPQSHEAAPCWLRWIENNSEAGADEIITPCHEYIEGEWVWQGNCEDTFPINPGQSYTGATWGNDCGGVTYGGGSYPNAGNTPQGPGDDSPGPGGDSGGGLGCDAGFRGSVRHGVDDGSDWRVRISSVKERHRGVVRRRARA